MQQTIQFGQVAQPSTLSQVRAFVKSQSENVQRKASQLAAQTREAMVVALEYAKLFTFAILSFTVLAGIIFVAAIMEG